VCTLTTEEFDAIAGADRILTEDTVNELLEDTLGKAHASEFFVGGDPANDPLFRCTETSSFAQYPADPVGLGPTDCVYSYFPDNPDWEGSYSSWRVIDGGSRAVNNLFDDAFDPLKPFWDRRFFTEYALWFTGAAYCDCHSEFVHGAYWSGKLAANEILDEMGYDILENGNARALENTDEYKKCFESCATAEGVCADKCDQIEIASTFHMHKTYLGRWCVNRCVLEPLVRLNQRLGWACGECPPD
jgi:hypothetical protein